VLSDVIDALACPVCAVPLACENGTLSCSNGHGFDVAREGYVSLLGGAGPVSTGDTPHMVRARRDLLASGVLACVTDAVVRAAISSVPPDAPGVLIDAGGGTGEYLAAVLDALPGRFGVVVDASKHAARMAARAHPRMSAVVADVWKPLPVRDSAAALVTCVFAPRNAQEFARVLMPGGALVVVIPTKKHLQELVEPLGLITVDPLKRERLDAKLSPLFELASEESIADAATLTREQAVQAALMGPTGSHASEAELVSRSSKLPERVDVTISVSLLVYAHRSGAATT